jgi:uncharacterized oligopeptide transporter (OPT) family protein
MDRRWLAEVYRGDVPQLTPRVVVTGFVLGGALSITNLYVGAKTGATVGVTITAVILAFGLFRLLRRLGLGTDLGLLENTMVQSIAGSAGYIASPLSASMAAYMVVKGAVIPWWQMTMWLWGLAVLGLLCAIPIKRAVINEQQMPFPEGKACGVVLETLHSATQDAVAAKRPARWLLLAFVTSGVIGLLQSGSMLTRLRLGFLRIPESLDEWYYRLAARHEWWLPTLGGAPLRELTIRPSLDMAMMGLGGLMGMGTCVSLLAGAVINYCLLAPWMVARGDIASGVGPDGLVTVGFRAITTWSLWIGAAMMTTASLFSLLARPRIFTSLSRLFADPHRQRDDPLRHIELPMSVYLVGGLLASVYVVGIANWFFGVQIWMGVVAIPLVFACTWIGVVVTGLTSITPTGALGKITQLAYGVVAPGNTGTNLATAGLAAETALQASSFLQSVKPGYMLGAKPRLQAVGHLIGAAAGGLCTVAIFYPLFLKNDPSGLIGSEFPFPAASVWKAVAEVLTRGVGALPATAITAAIVGGLLAIVLEFVRTRSSERFTLSPVAMGLAFVIPFHICLAMFFGGLLFWLPEGLGSTRGQRIATAVRDYREPICAGVIAGAALVGIGIMAVEAWLLP